MDRWRGKVAIVTGASGKVGASIAEQLIKEGLQVVGFDHNAQLIERAEEKLQNRKKQFHVIKVNMSKEEDIIKGFKWVTENLGPVHILVNNAKIIQDTSLTDGDAEKWRRVFDTNVLGLSIATREAVRIMRENSIDGHIVHINSIGGHRVPLLPNINVFPASKFAVRALTEALRQELNSLGLKIKISSISPGVIFTEIVQAINNNAVSAEFAQKVITMPTLKPQDVADAVLYVLSTPPHVQVHEIIIKPLGEVLS